MTMKGYEEIIANHPAMSSTRKIIDSAEVPTLEQILEAADHATRMFRPVGTLYGMPVYVDPSVDPHMIEIRSPQRTIRFSVEHPYIQGTALERAVRAAKR